MNGKEPDLAVGTVEEVAGKRAAVNSQPLYSEFLEALITWYWLYCEWP